MKLKFLWISLLLIACSNQRRGTGSIIDVAFEREITETLRSQIMQEADWAMKQAKDSKNANRIVCHYEDVPGSRLQGQKICQPASAWAEDRRAAREATEKVQMGTPPPH